MTLEDLAFDDVRQVSLAVLKSYCEQVSNLFEREQQDDSILLVVIADPTNLDFDGLDQITEPWQHQFSAFFGHDSLDLELDDSGSWTVPAKQITSITAKMSDSTTRTVLMSVPFCALTPALTDLGDFVIVGIVTPAPTAALDSSAESILSGETAQTPENGVVFEIAREYLNLEESELSSFLSNLTKTCAASLDAEISADARFVIKR